MVTIVDDFDELFNKSTKLNNLELGIIQNDIRSSLVRYLVQNAEHVKNRLAIEKYREMEQKYLKCLEELKTLRIKGGKFDEIKKNLIIPDRLQ